MATTPPDAAPQRAPHAAAGGPRSVRPGAAPAAEQASAGPHVSHELAVRTGTVTRRGLQAGLGAWLTWVIVLGTLAYGFAQRDDPWAWNSLGGALALLGLVPAFLVTHLVSRHTRQRLLWSQRGIVADDETIIDFARGIDACVIAHGAESALVVVQQENHVILFGRDISKELGGPEAWSDRWHAISLDHASARASALGRDGHLWASYWTVHGPTDALVAGEVGSTSSLRALAERVVEAGACGGQLCLPLRPHTKSVVRVSAAGVLSAFGERIDTGREFLKSYIWALGKENTQKDADALLVRQESQALCLSMVQHPGGWPRVGSVLPVAPEFPSPELPVDQTVDPVVFGSVDTLLSQKKQRLRSEALLP